MSNESTINSSSLTEKSYAAHKNVFQTICKYGLVVVAIRLISNLWIGNSWLPVIADLITGIVVFIGWLLSERLKDYTILTWPFIILTQISSFFLWFGMGGLAGPAIAFNLTILFLYLLLDHRKRYVPIGLCVVATTLMTIALEYFFPEWVVHYNNAFIQSIDTGVVFICMIITVTLVSRLIVKRYDAEKAIAIEKTAALEDLQEKDAIQKQLQSKLEALQTQSFLGQVQQEGIQKLLALLIETTYSQYGFVVQIKSKESAQELEVLAVRDGQQKLEEAPLLQAGYWKGNNGLHHLQDLVTAITSDKTAQRFPIVPAQAQDLTVLVCFPILYNNETIGLIGIANKEGYSDTLIERATPFLPICGNMLHHIYLQRQQTAYEMALKESKDIAEQAVTAKNQLFTNISHELRTPLSLVVGPISALLQNAAQNGIAQEAQESLDMVLRNSKNMLQYINDIMDLAKLNSSTLELHKRDNHLYTFIQSIYQAFEIQKKYRQVDYQLVYNANRELVVQFDPKKMEKILNNLLSNAFKYTPDGGAITLRVEEEEEYLYVEVKDTGVGIAADELPYIFERFYQSKNAQQISAKGTGIGLALAQELAQLQGFQIEIESIVNQGTRLFFRMSKNDMVVEQVQLAASTSTIGQAELSEKDSNKPSILVVEDNHDMASFVKLVLQNDYNIDLAANGAIGWQTLQEQESQYDLVITDLMMPEMDGFELLRHIKSSTWGSTLPVVVLTARADSQSKLEALTIGIDEYLTKPFSVEELTIHVKNLIQNAAIRQQVAQQTETTPEVEVEAEAIEDANNATRIPSTQDARMTALQREKIEEAQRVVLEQLDNTEFSVDDLARALITSKRQLYRFMQLHTGLTPLKFINEIRLQEARRMLEQGMCSTVKEVSYSIGFMSTRHFSKTYSNRFGKKPSEYLR
ncbi:MAG: response regulator [Aureispira sp.]